MASRFIVGSRIKLDFHIWSGEPWWGGFAEMPYYLREHEGSPTLSIAALVPTSPHQGPIEGDHLCPLIPYGEVDSIRAEPAGPDRAGRQLPTSSPTRAWLDAPDHLSSNNCGEFIVHLVQDWLREDGIKTVYFQPGSPWQNG